MSHQLFITIGILAAAVLGMESVWSTPGTWRLLYGFFVVPSTIHSLAFWTCPESPRYLRMCVRGHMYLCLYCRCLLVYVCVCLSVPCIHEFLSLLYGLFVIPSTIHSLAFWTCPESPRYLRMCVGGHVYSVRIATVFKKSVRILRVFLALNASRCRISFLLRS